MNVEIWIKLSIFLVAPWCERVVSKFEYVETSSGRFFIVWYSLVGKLEYVDFNLLI